MLRKTIVLLVVLRLAIGWHFFFEGYHKIHSTAVGQTETNRPFSSEGYFREATGPLGPIFRAQIGDLDELALARLTVQPIPEGKDNKTVKAAERVPEALAQELDNYVERFLAAFTLDDVEKKQAQAKADQAKSQVVEWLTYSLPDDEKEREKDKDKMWRMVKKASPDGKTNEVPMSANLRLVEYRVKLAEVRELRDRKLPALGRDVEKARLGKAKADLAAMRKELTDDLDKLVTANLKDGLNDILKEKLARVNLPAVPAGEDEVKFLLPATDGALLPKPYNAVFDEYVKVVTDTYSLSDEQKTMVGTGEKGEETKLKTAKSRTAKWLVDKKAKARPEIDYRLSFLNVFAYGSSPHPSAPMFSIVVLDPYLLELRSEARSQVAQMKTTINTVLTDDQSKGIPPAVKPGWTFLRVMDLLTMWGLTIMGACLLLGFFTRTNCVLAAGFLLMTYLMSPPFPWVPSPPNNEGNYLFVNKNVVEMLALLVLATTASGKWFGLDATLAWIFGRRKPKLAPESRARAA